MGKLEKGHVKKRENQNVDISTLQQSGHCKGMGPESLFYLFNHTLSLKLLDASAETKVFMKSGL